MELCEAIEKINELTNKKFEVFVNHFSTINESNNEKFEMIIKHLLTINEVLDDYEKQLTSMAEYINLLEKRISVLEGKES